MRRHLISHIIIIVLIGISFVGLGLNKAIAQESTQIKVRIKADYVKVMDEGSYLDISTSARIDKKNVSVPDLDLIIINETDDEDIELGSATANSKGKIKFTLPELRTMVSDSSQFYNLKVSFKGNELYKKANRNVQFKDAEISARLIEKDSLHFISATIIDANSRDAISGELLDVQIERLFKPLKMGEEFNSTDEKGTVLVPIEQGIPGIDGILNIEVVLNDNDTYGTVKALVKAPIGKAIVDESTFDQRTLWSPRNKTPWFFLVFANAIILAMWGIIIYLVINLFRIKKV